MSNALNQSNVMTTAAIFTAAHAAARLADEMVAYRTRFATALRAAWAAAKQTLTKTVSAILATIEKPNLGFTDIYDIFHVGQQSATGTSPADLPAITTAFAMSRPLDELDTARFFFLTSYATDRRSQPFTTYNGTSLYRQSDVTLRNIDSERTQQAYGFTAADVAAFKKAANL